MGRSGSKRKLAAGAIVATRAPRKCTQCLYPNNGRDSRLSESTQTDKGSENVTDGALSPPRQLLPRIVFSPATYRAADTLLLQYLIMRHAIIQF